MRSSGPAAGQAAIRRALATKKPIIAMHQTPGIGAG